MRRELLGMKAKFPYSPATWAYPQRAVVACEPAMALALMFRLEVQPIDGRSNALPVSRAASGTASTVNCLRVLDQGIDFSPCELGCMRSLKEGDQ